LSMVECRKRLRELIEADALIGSGLKQLNGGYAEVRKLRIRADKEKRAFIIDGTVASGIEDCGDGHSEEYVDRFDGVEIPFEKAGFVPRRR